MAVYKIHEANVDRLVKRVNAIIKKGEKFSCPITCTRLDEEFVNIGTEDNPDWQKFINFEISGEVKIDGRQFVATLKHVPGSGNIICAANYDEVIPEIYSTRCECDHGHSHRIRKDTYLLKTPIRASSSKLVAHAYATT